MDSSGAARFTNAEPALSKFESALREDAPVTVDLKPEQQRVIDLAVTLPKETPPMTGIQFVTDEKGRKLAVQIDLKRYGAVLEDFWDGLISESRRKEKGVPLEKLKADLVKRGRLRG